ncbi:phosphoribosyl-AMP cyclohydrolase [Candidatus Fermentibacteria bacterium]|nr:phosphoribosyl-AMP cyclohydrolase [Candidatus Fermentibacteria bacterium]
MIVPSIDLSEGRAVQLRRGKEKILTSDRDPVELAVELNRYGEVAVIDLDAAMGTGDNLELQRELCEAADVRAGGGIRSEERARKLLASGARTLILGTAVSEDFVRRLPRHRVQAALDHVGGEVVDRGWTGETGEGILQRAEKARPYVGSYLCTFVADEGSMEGMDIPAAKKLRNELDLPLTVAGGIACTEEVVELSRAGIDVQVGMALYKGLLDPVEAVVDSLSFPESGLLPTIAQDGSGQVLMLAYSSRESLLRALREGRGIYYSRSRDQLWVKGETSGNLQSLISCRADCDRDTILFTLEQTGAACHTGSYSCFGSRRFTMPELFEVIRQRKRDMPEGSYVASLLADPEKLSAKIREEAAEVVSAEDHDHLVWELADLLFFMSVRAAGEDIEWKRIVSELGGRR